MSHDTTHSHSPNPARPTDTAVCLDMLRQKLKDMPDLGELDGVLEGLSVGVEKTLAEHQGMAEELLCVYEQLGIVFDVTRELPRLENEAAVLELFLIHLRRSFEGRVVEVARRRRDGRWILGRRPIEKNSWLIGRLDEVCTQQTAKVETPPAGSMPASIAEVLIGPIVAGESLVGALVLFRPQDSVPLRASEMLIVESLTTFCGDLVRNYRLVRELREMSIAMVRSLVNAVDQKDEYTCGHSLRVGWFATALGQRLGLGKEDLKMLRWSALLHDVGKIGIRDDVLKKKGKLTDEEFDHIKEHPVRSHKVVQEVPQLAAALDGILYHHERFDGRGYPAGLKGEGIPLQARIIQIADIFDALTSNRSYREAFSWQKALDIIREEAGSTVDPKLQPIFDDIIRQRVKSNEGAWEELVREASSFTRHAEDDEVE